MDTPGRFRLNMTFFRQKYSFSLVTGIVLLAAAAGCYESGGVHEITQTREAKNAHAPTSLDMSSAARFFGPQAAQQMASTENSIRPSLEWKTPPGWQNLPPAPMREINLAAGDPPMTECYVSSLPVSGGGLEANVNRWRQQMGLAPDSADAIYSLPDVQVLGHVGKLVELNGTYAGMRGDEQREDAKMLAAFVPAGDRAITVKMIGPAEQVDAERENFDFFLSSLAEPGVAAAVPETPHAAEHEGGESTIHEEVGGIAFDVPQEWTRTGERPMRLVTYTLNESGETECYISQLSGDGGGVDANLNRWASQMGQSPLSPEAIEALPKIAVLDNDVPVLETAGTFTSMRGESKEGYGLIGVFLPLGDTSYSIKLIGPEEEVAAAKDEFIAFCESLHIH
jgi:hypothetical protein